MELYNKYRPQTWEDVLGNEDAVKSIKSELEHGSHVFLFTGNGGCGKAQPLDTIIPTPNGNKRFGDLVVGDYVFDRHGNPTKVIGVYDRGKLEAYRVTLKDGRSTICNDDHLWSFYTSKGNLKTLSLREMIDNEISKKDKRGSTCNRYYIPNNEFVKYPSKDVSIDPYVLGSLIGNGCLTERQLVMSSDDEEQVNEVARLIDATPHKRSEHNYSWSFVCNETPITARNTHVLTADLFESYPEFIGCKSSDKFIPNDYKYNDFECRQNLIQGLFDTDGSISVREGRYTVSYSSVSERLIDDICEVLHSLGILSVKHCYHREGKNDCYTLIVCCDNEDKPSLFRLSRKKNIALESLRYKKRRCYYKTPITSVEKLGYETEMRCIKVDNEEELYLTNDFIVTHNTTTARILAKEVGAGELSVHELNSAENRGIDTVRELSDMCRYAPADGTATVFILDEMHQQTSASQNALLKILEECPEYCYFVLCTTDPQKLIAPLKTRCSKVNFKPLDNDTMVRLLRKVSRREMQKVSDDVFLKIAELANGSSRDGLKILASVLYLDSDEERLNYLAKNGSGVDDDAIVLPRTLMHTTDWGQISKVLNEIDMSNAEGVRQLCMSYATSVLLKGYNQKAEAMIQCFSNQDTYRNGKYAIIVACLDYCNMLNG